MKAMHKNGVLLSEEIYRIKELFGNDFKPVIKEQREIIKKPRKIIKEQRELAIRRAFDFDLGGALTAAEQVAKVQRYLTDIERGGEIFSMVGQNGLIYPYENIRRSTPNAQLGWRSSADFMDDIATVADPTLPSADRVAAIERTIRQLNTKDYVKFEAKVKTGAQALLALELRTEGSAFRTQLNDAITQVLDTAIANALNTRPNITKQELIDFVDQIYETVRTGLTEDLGANSASLFEPVLSDVKDRIRNDDNVENAPTKPKYRSNIFSRLSQTNWFRIRRVFENIRQLGIGVTEDANIENTRLQLTYFVRYDLSPFQKQAIYERVRQNISSVISGDLADKARFREALKQLDAAIDGLDLPDVTKADLKIEIRKKITLSWWGAKVGEPYNWVEATEKELTIAHEGGEGVQSKLYTLLTGNVVGSDVGLGEWFTNAGLNMAKRLINISITGQLRYLNEIGADTRSFQGGARRRFFKSYMWMLMMKFLLLPLIELAYTIPLTNTACKRWKLNRDEAMKIFKDAGGGKAPDATDIAFIDKQLKMPKGCDVIMTSNGWRGALEVYKNEANSIFGTVENYLKMDPNDNWLGTKQGWAITVENTFDLLNPFGSLLDNVLTMYSYQNFDKATSEFKDKIDNEANKIRERV
jgi:hypothetical protein